MKKLSRRDKVYIKYCMVNCYDEYIRTNGKPNKTNLEYFLMGLYEKVLGISGQEAVNLVIKGNKKR